MHRLDGELPPAKSPGDVHEATDIRGDDDFRTCAHDIPDLLLKHRCREVGHFHREHASKSAALVPTWQVDKLQAAYVPEEAKGFLSQSQGTEPVAGCMVRCLPPEGSTHILDLKHPHEELRELIGAFAQLPCLLQEPGFLLEQEWVILSDHGHTRTGGCDDDLAPGKGPEELLGHLPSLWPEPIVEGRLTTARLIFWEVHLYPYPVQDFHRGFPYLGEELIHKTGHKERNPHAVTSMVPISHVAQRFLGGQPASLGHHQR